MKPNAVSAHVVLNFALECLKRGARVSAPLISNNPYNLVVDSNGRLFRILVKASSPNKDGAYQLNATKKVQVASVGGTMSSKSVAYDQSDIDLIVGEFFGTWAFLPDVMALPATVTFHPHNPEIGQRYAASRNNWASIGLSP